MLGSFTLVLIYFMTITAAIITAIAFIALSSPLFLLLLNCYIYIPPEVDILLTLFSHLYLI